MRFAMVVTLVAAAFGGSVACSQVWGIEELPAGSLWNGDATTDDAGSDGADGDDALTDSEPPAVDAGCSCYPVAPSGWTGPVAMAQAQSPSQPPGCAPPYDTRDPSFPQLLADLQQPPAACSQCACNMTQPPECTMTVTWFHSPTNCPSTNGCGIQTITNYGCNGLTTVTGSCAGTPVEEYKVTAIDQPRVPVCAVAGSSTPIGTASWGTTAVDCVTSAPLGAGSCGPQQVCAPAPSPSFPTLCIWSAGANACPGAPYGHPYVFYTGSKDERVCSACTCTGLSPSCTGGDIFFRSDSACASQTGFNSSPTQGTCYSLAGSSYYADYHPTMTGGACTASGGTYAGGMVTPQNATTFCCTQ